MATSYVPSGTSLFQSTPSAWRETEIVPTLRLSKYISIHSLRMEGDRDGDDEAFRILHFNPLPPHGGRLAAYVNIYLHEYFNPLPPHGGRRGEVGNHVTFAVNFNPLPPHGGRPYKMFVSTPFRNFNPLPPHGGRRKIYTLHVAAPVISIHSLRMEGDIVYTHTLPQLFIFQSTPSAWRETDGEQPVYTIDLFQSTPSAWRETGVGSIVDSALSVFQSTPSAWRET